MTTGPIETRQALPSDAEAIAEAHLESIRSIGPAFYPPNVVDDWAEGLTGEVYVKAMEGGEVFFIATGTIDGRPAVLGFSSDYRIEGTRHGTSVYVRGRAARLGIGSTLYRLAEAHADHGRSDEHSRRSVARRCGFLPGQRIRGGRARAHAQLMSGRAIACVFMRKNLVKK